MLSRLIGRSGSVDFDAIMDESPQYQNKITEHAVESGQDVSDHVKGLSDSLNLRGVIAGTDAASRLQRLKEFKASGDPLIFVGRNIFSQMVIESFTPVHGPKTRDGFEFSLTLKNIRIAQSRTVQIAVPAPAVGTTQTSLTQNAGTQQPKAAEPFFSFQPRLNAQSPVSMASLRALEGRV